jgi:hypothetical protein
MKKKGFSELDDDLRPEYRPEDFAGMRAERGKFASRLRLNSNIVVIEPALTKAFPNARAVNAALRRLLAIRPARAAAKSGKGRKRRKRAAR